MKTPNTWKSKVRVPSILLCTMMAGLSAAQADNTSKFETADADSSGALDFTEFSTTLNPHVPSKQVTRKFNRADVDSDSLVTLDEWLDYKSDLKDKKDDLEKHTAQFEAADTDVDSFITYDEFIASTRGKKPLIQVRKKFLKIDSDDDSLISLDEWLAYKDDDIDDADWKNPRKFDLADLDDDGELSIDEFATTFPRKTKLKPILKKFEKLDDDDNGSLSREEWNPGTGKKGDKGKKPNDL
jgi:Ca2+-binding EF-hand superfamily protein